MLGKTKSMSKYPAKRTSHLAFDPRITHDALLLAGCLDTSLEHNRELRRESRTYLDSSLCNFASSFVRLGNTRAVSLPPINRDSLITS